ncbi:MAG: ABC transporter permease [Ignavibacteriales bacterium]|nr:ABC transporter permease [Ignavibacteriales bacterium]
MKQFLAFVRKEIYHIMRDVRTIMILLGIPVIQIILFGFAISTEVRNAEIAIYDPSNDAATRRIAEQIETSSYFNIVKYISSPKEIDQLFKKGEVSIVLVFADRFREKMLHTGKGEIQIIADASDPNNATSLTNYLRGIIGVYQQELMKEQKVPYQITSEVKLLYNPQMKGAYNFVPGVLGMILMLICAMMTSIAVVREKEMGTMEVLLVSPMKPLLIIIAKAVPYFLLSCINLTTVLLLSVFVLDVPVAGSLFWLITVSLVFIFVSLSLGLLVSTITESQMIAMLISGMVFMLPVVLLSGMMFPVENMPDFLQWISLAIPARWYIAAVKDIMIKGLGFEGIVKELVILSGMIVFLLAVSLKKFKSRLE